MPARSAYLHLAAKSGIVFAALFLVSVLLAAMPSHRTPAVQTQESQEPSASQSHDAQQGMEHGSMPGMEMDDAKANEARAVHDMTRGHMDAHNLHLHMTAMRPQTPEDLARASETAAQLRSGIEKYKDYHVALNGGYKIFLPNLPQPEYHFTNYWNGFLEAFTFDPARPTSLLYRKTATGYELVGAMYTMPKRVAEDQLDARVPLSVAMWHLHTNLCMPPKISSVPRTGPGSACAAPSPRSKPATPLAAAFALPFSAGWSTFIRTKILSRKSSPCTTTWTDRLAASASHL